LATLYKNISLLSIIQIANVLIPLATLPYLARVMGTETFGQYALLFAVLQYVILVAEYGFNLSTTKKIVNVKNDISQLSRVFWTVMLCKLVLLCIAWIPVWVLVNISEKFRSLQELMIWGLPYVVGFILFPHWLLQGLDLMKEMAVASVVGRVALLPMLYYGVNGPEDLSHAVGLTGLSACLTAFIALWVVSRKTGVQWQRPDRNSIHSSIKDGAYIFASSVATNIYSVSVVVLLGYAGGPVEVARFTVADKLRQAVQVMLTPVQQALYPRMSELMVKNPHEAFKLVRKILPIVFSYCTFSGLVLVIAADWLIQLIFGRGYESAEPVLWVLAFLPLVVAISGLLGVQILTVSDRQGVVFRSLLMGAGFCVAAIYPLTLLWGAIGAAMTVFLTELLIALLLWWAVEREFPEFGTIVRRASRDVSV